MAGIPFTAVQNGERSPYGGGGGKMRTRRAPKRSTTPYDRPAVGRHASAGPQAAALMNGGVPGDGARRGTWLGAGLLGTASKIVTTGASYLYSSFFRRRDAPLLLNEAEKATVEIVEGQADVSPSAAEAESTEAGSQHGEEDKRLEVESWMKRIFPREEADRMIAMLRSSVKENGIGEDKIDQVNTEGKMAIINQVTSYESTPSNGPQSDTQRWREERTKARQEQKSILWTGGPGKENGTPTRAGTSEAGEAMESSPIDLARAYMGERVTRVVGPARVTLTREKVTTPLRLSPYQPSPYQTRQLLQDREAKLRTSPGIKYSTQPESPPVARSLGLPPPVAIRGVSDDKLWTPPVTRTIGRLPPMNRTNAPGSALDIQKSGEGSRKRGSAALEDGGYSSGGPIRRLRPRSSLYTPSPASALQRRGGLGMYPPPPRTLQTPIAFKPNQTAMWSWGGENEGKSNVHHTEQKNEETRGVFPTPGTHVSVPERASETARKILETLDMMTPSPKEKSLDTELALVRERPPTELTTSMMNDKARQTMQSWDLPGLHPEEEAGPSGRGRNLENDLSSVGEFSLKGTDYGAKSRGRGKAPVSGSSPSFQDKNTDQSPDHLQAFSGEPAVRLKESDANLANAGPTLGRNKGFQINADLDDSDEETRGVNNNLPTTTVTSTLLFSTGKSASTGVDSIPSKSMNNTAPVIGAPAPTKSQKPVTDLTVNLRNPDGKPTMTLPSGGFTFPFSNLVGTSLDPPPTPKPFPSPTFTAAAPAATINGAPTYKFNTGATGDKSVFTLPSAGTAGAETVAAKVKFDNKPETKLEVSVSSTSAAVSVTPQPLQSRESSPQQTTAAEPTISDTPVSSGASVPETSSFPFTPAASSTTSIFSLSNFGAPGAGAKQAFAGVFATTSSSTPAAGTAISGQTMSLNPGIFGSNTQAQTTTSVSKTEDSTFAFGKTPSASTPLGTPALTAASPLPIASSSIFGSNTTTAAFTTAATPAFTFGAPTFGLSKSPFLFGAAPSSALAPPVQSTAPSTSSAETNGPEKRMFGQDKSQKPDAPVVSTVTFGLSATSTTPTTTPSSGGFPGVSSSSAPSPALFSFGQGSSSSAQGSTPAVSTAPPVFGLTPASTASAPTISSTTTLPPLTFGSAPNPFGASAAPSSPFGSSVFGSSNSVPAFGAASSTPAFGASTANTKPAFNSEASAQPSPAPSVFSGFGAPANLGPTSSTTFSFGAPSSAASASPFSFGASSAASTGAFSFGASSAASPASTFSFGAKPVSVPTFGLGSSAPAFGSSPNGAMANDGSGENNMEDSMAEEQMLASSPPAQQQAPLLFGAPQTPGSGTFLFGQQPSTPVATPSPGVFSFGNQTTPAGGNAFTPSPVVANPFATPQQGQQGGLNFAGGAFSVGTSGQDPGTKTNRKIFKAKRTGRK